MKFFFTCVAMSVLTGCASFSNSHRELSSVYEKIQKECDDLTCVRSNIDRINSKLLTLLTERTAYVRRAGDLKRQQDKKADDKQRVIDQEKAVISESVALGLPLEISVPAFRALVKASIKYEQEYIDKLSTYCP